MKTPGQRQLITLQEQVKLGIVNVDEAVLHFKEWQLNQKKRSESFRFQQVASWLWEELVSCLFLLDRNRGLGPQLPSVWLQLSPCSGGCELFFLVSS